MDPVRPFTPDDITPVANLFQQVFRRSQAPAPESLRQYFHALYFENPWYDAELPSLVYEEAGTVRGFLGVLPFPLRVNGTRRRGVIGGNYMVDPALQKQNAFAGVKILKRFFAGPQDVAMTDTSNETGRKMWESMGGATLQLYSLQWLHILCPTRFVMSRIGQKKLLSPLEIVSRPFCSAMDAMAARMTRETPAHDGPELHAEPLTREILLEGMKLFTARQAVVPDYEPQSLQWLLDMADQKREYGPLRKLALYNSKQSLLGWYLYYPNPGRNAQVLQLMARPNCVDQVLGHLFADARAHGSIAVVGRVDPRHVGDLSARHCLFVNRGTYVQALAKSPEIVQNLHSGNACLTRLEGEWWTRLQGDEFN